MAKNPNITKLSEQQILQRVYDEPNDQLRTTIDASVNIGGQQTLVITSQEDSIVVVGTTDGTLTGPQAAIRVAPDGTVQVSGTISAVNPSVGPTGAPPPVQATLIGGTDGTDLIGLKVAPDGSLYTIPGGSIPSNTKVINAYNEVTGVASSITTQVVTYTVPLSKTAVFQKASVSGENIAKFTLLFNSVVVDTRRTFFGSMNEIFDFLSWDNNGTQLVAGDNVQIQVLHTRPTVATFEARLQILEIS